VIGLGTQQDLAAAKDFVSRTKVTFPMLWDAGFTSWRALGITGQPAAVLVSADGRELGRWLGRIDAKEAEILRLAANA
jgi:hypothetical protein